MPATPWPTICFQIPHSNSSDCDFLSMGFWQKNKQAGAELCQPQSELGWPATKHYTGCFFYQLKVMNL
jgi:hypothetical protein